VRSPEELNAMSDSMSLDATQAQPAIPDAVQPTAAVVDTQLADISELAWSDEDAEHAEIVSHSWATTFTKAGLILACGLVVVGIAVSVLLMTGSGISPTSVPTTSVTVPAAPPPTVTVQAAPLPTAASTPGCDDLICPSVYDQDFLTRLTRAGT
jgi:hypothetical protein